MHWRFWRWEGSRTEEEIAALEHRLVNLIEDFQRVNKTEAALLASGLRRLAPLEHSHPQLAPLEHPHPPQKEWTLEDNPHDHAHEHQGPVYNADKGEFHDPATGERLYLVGLVSCPDCGHQYDLQKECNVGAAQGAEIHCSDCHHWFKVGVGVK